MVAYQLVVYKVMYGILSPRIICVYYQPHTKSQSINSVTLSKHDYGYREDMRSTQYRTVRGNPPLHVQD
jgi:hypothetical protein